MRFFFEEPLVDFPTDEELKADLASHSDRYMVPRAWRVSQVYLGTERPPPSRLSAWRATLDENPEALVGRLLSIGRDLGWVEQPEVERLFSKAGAERLASAPEKSWVGPLRSRFGHQVVKLWGDPAGGGLRERVYAIAGDQDDGASVDQASCRPSGNGAASFCSAWKDPAFSSAQAAVYYTRVIEDPTCRWIQHLCNEVPDGETRPDNCTDATVAKVVQERAWSTPIWYEPPPID